MSTRLAITDEFDRFDILFKDMFKESQSGFVPTFGTKLPHPLDIYETKDGLIFEVACTGIDKDAVKISTEDRDILKITYEKPKETENSDRTYVHRGLSKKSFNLAYKIASRYDLESTTAKMNDGLLKITIPFAEASKPRTLTIE